MEAVVGFVAIQAKGFAAGHTDPVGTRNFSTATTGVGIKQTCLLRQRDGCFLHIEHFFRGSVYCKSIPNQDSLAPIYDYMRHDVRVLMESMQWQ